VAAMAFFNRDPVVRPGSISSTKPHNMIQNLKIDDLARLRLPRNWVGTERARSSPRCPGAQRGHEQRNLCSGHWLTFMRPWGGA
jgi:hypothetical protein